nr:FAD-dependent tricarballylate dehydrogenase TcuA [Motilimonas eburnea]
MIKTISCDVVVIGAGNAGLCAAISAAQKGKSVVILEKSPKVNRGGNSSLTMNFRFTHSNLFELCELTDCPKQTEMLIKSKYYPYSPSNFYDDIMKSSKGMACQELSKTLSEHSYNVIKWLYSLGHRWEVKPNILEGSVPIRIKGGGATLQEKNFSVAESLGVKILYESKLNNIIFDNSTIAGVSFSTNNTIIENNILCKSIVLACGGFQANSLKVAENLGFLWSNVPVRGVPFNTGEGIYAAIKAGAIFYGDKKGCHSTPQGVNISPYSLPGDHEQVQLNSRYCFNLGITVNQVGKRFFDEGEDNPNFLYAKLGGEILKQPNRICYQIFDSRTAALLPKGYFVNSGMVCSNELSKLASHFGIREDTLAKEIDEFNASIEVESSEFVKKDGLTTNGLLIPKSNWSIKIIQPPFFICPVVTGLTFTYGGIKINEHAQVLSSNNTPIKGLYACGEIVGGAHYHNYAGGTGLMLGSVFGYIAGKIC